MIGSSEFGHKDSKGRFELSRTKMKVSLASSLLVVPIILAALQGVAGVLDKPSLPPIGTDTEGEEWSGRA